MVVVDGWVLCSCILGFILCPDQAEQFYSNSTPLNLSVLYIKIFYLFSLLGTTHIVKIPCRDYQSPYPEIQTASDLLIFVWDKIPSLSPEFLEKLVKQYKYIILVTSDKHVSNFQGYEIHLSGVSVSFLSFSAEKYSYPFIQESFLVSDLPPCQSAVG